MATTRRLHEALGGRRLTAWAALHAATLGAAQGRAQPGHQLQSAGPAADRLSPVVAWTGSELFVGGCRLCANTREPSPSADLLDDTP